MGKLIKLRHLPFPSYLVSNESKASQGFYEKLMSKYEADPDDPMAKFQKAKPRELSDTKGAKERVKQALRKEEEDPMIPGKRR